MDNQASLSSTIPVSDNIKPSDIETDWLCNRSDDGSIEYVIKVKIKNETETHNVQLNGIFMNRLFIDKGGACKC